MIEDKRVMIVRTIIKYMVAFMIASSLCVFALWARDIFNIEDKKELYRALSDSFCIPGILLIMIGVLITLSNEGALDFLGYAFRSLGRALIPMYKANKQTYIEYVQNKKKMTGYAFIYFVGLFFFIIGIIFTVLFFTVK